MSFINNTVSIAAGVAAVAVYTCPADLKVTLSTISVFAPASAAKLTLSVFRQNSGQTVPFLTARDVPVNEPYTHPKPIMLAAGDQLLVAAVDDDLSVDLGGVVSGAAAETSALVPRGAYDANATYQKLHFAESGETSYLCLVNGLKGDAPPSVNWMVMAGKGETGDPGLDGTDGIDGIDGVDGVPAELVDRLADLGIQPNNEMLTVGNRLILTHDVFVQEGFDLQGKTLEAPFGSTLRLTKVDPATRRSRPLITEDETITDMLVVGTLHVMSGVTLTATGTLEILSI